MSVKIGINGFGRIGRNFFRAARKLGVERTTARLKSRSRSSSRSWRVRSVKSRTMKTNSSGPQATTRPS